MGAEVRMTCPQAQRHPGLPTGARSWKRQGSHSAQSLWKEHSPVDPLISDFWPQEQWENKFLVTPILQLVVICYSTHRMLIQTPANGNTNTLSLLLAEPWTTGGSCFFLILGFSTPSQGNHSLHCVSYGAIGLDGSIAPERGEDGVASHTFIHEHLRFGHQLHGLESHLLPWRGWVAGAAGLRVSLGPLFTEEIGTLSSGCYEDAGK